MTKKKSPNIESKTTTEIHNLMVACGEHFVAKKWSLGGTLDELSCNQLSSARSNIGLCITSLLQLDGSLDECRFATESVKKMRWSNVFRKNSFRLRLFRFAFLNGCYSYTERIKLVADQFELAKTDIASQTINGFILETLKNAKKKLKQFNQERGEIVHSWHRDHNSIYVLSLVELLADSEAEKYEHDVHGHFLDSRFDILLELNRGVAEIEKLHTPLLRETAIVLTQSVTAFNERVENAKLHGLEVYRS